MDLETIAKELKEKVEALGLVDYQVTVKYLHKAVKVTITGYINL